MATEGYPGFSQPIGKETTAAFARRMIGRASTPLKTGATKTAYAHSRAKGLVQRATRKTRGEFFLGKGAVGKKVPPIDWYKKNLGISKGVAGNIGLGVMLAMMIKGMFTKEQQFRQTTGMQDIQAEHLRQTGAMGADQYYAAALPELQQERQMAQQALMQMIMGGQNVPLQVPGERMIGGQGSGY